MTDVECKLNKSLDDLISDSRDHSGLQGRERGRGSRGRRGRGEKRVREQREHVNDEPATIKVARRVYVGNLNYSTSWQQLKDHFQSAGKVVYADVLCDANMGKSKGCGIVEFENAQEAADAINNLHLSELEGREIYVREDREDFELKQHGKRQSYTRSAGHSDPSEEYRQPIRKQQRHSSGDRIFVQNLSYETTWQSLKDHFNTDGNVAFANVLVDASGRSKGMGTLEFIDPEYAQHAIENMNGTVLDGRQLQLREDRDPPRQVRSPAERVVKLRVKNLSYRTSWQELKDHFKRIGNVLHADVAQDGNGRSQGWGVVEYADVDTAQAAVSQLDSSDLDGRRISVKWHQ